MKCTTYTLPPVPCTPPVLPGTYWHVLVPVHYMYVHPHVHTFYPHTCMYMCTHTFIHTVSTVGFRWSWAWNDERGEWEFEKKTKITQYRHNINTSIKNRVIVSFYNVSYGLSDSWFAKKRKNIFLHVQPILFFFLIWRFYDFWFFSIQIGSPAFLKITFQLHRNPTVLM